MKHIKSDNLTFVPAGHEDALNPGVWKKVLALYPDAPAGRIQMVNWAKMEAGQHSSLHHHTSMHEIFIMASGGVIFSNERERIEAKVGDMVVVEAMEHHSLHNAGKSEANFIAIGLVIAEGGKTVIL